MASVLIGLAVILAIPLSLLLLGRGLRPRTMTVEAYARQHSLGYSSFHHGLELRWPGEPFDLVVQQDHEQDPVVTDVVSGLFHDRAFQAFQYWRYAVYVVDLGGSLPPLDVSTVLSGRTISDASGLTEQLDLESEAFNARYQVRVHDRQYAYDVLTPRAMETMLGQPATCFRIVGSSLIAWRQDLLRPEDFESTLTALGTIADSIGEHVWEKYGSGSRPPHGSAT